MPALAGQVVIITGACAGIGEAVSRRLVRHGARVVVFSLRPDRLEALARELDPTGADVLAFAGDITSEADRKNLLAAALAKFGRVDALVNNAGYGTRGPVEIVPVELIRKNYETNIFSLIALTQLVLPGMRARGSGCVVNIGSVAGRIARPLSSVYDSTKHALEALTDGLRGELKPFGVRVSLVRPGFIATEFAGAAQASLSAAEIATRSGPYAPFYQNYSANQKPMRRVAGVPDAIAQLVERALTDDHPASRYSGPFHARFFLFLKWLLPDRAVEFLTRLRPARPVAG